MKKVIFAAILAIGLVAAANAKAQASDCRPWGLAPGYFSINLGLNVAYSGFQFGHFSPPCPPQQPACQGGPCYGQPGYGHQAAGPGYGYGPHYGYAYGPGYNYGYGAATAQGANHGHNYQGYYYTGTGYENEGKGDGEKKDGK